MSKKRKTRAEKIKSAKRLEKQREQWLKIQNVQDEYKMHLEELAKREKNNKKSRDIQMGGIYTDPCTCCIPRKYVGFSQRLQWLNLGEQKQLICIKEMI